ncbi:MAG: PRC-barrel domain containing protein [Actinomycetota bacterium]|nr:PRC-barrel domain containing protein [Actinomycetota bacterium]
MSDSIWNYRDDVGTRPSPGDEGDDDRDRDRNDEFDSAGVPMPPAAPTDAPLVDDPQRDPVVTDAPLADSGVGNVGATTQGIEVIGYDVEATDGGLGKIDESSLEAGSAYVVVDTGWWIFGKKRLIPAGVIQSIDHDNSQVFVGLTKEEIKSAPDFADEHREDRSGYDEYYGPYGR